MKKVKPPIFYIVVPSYNQAQFITQTLDSIVTQPKVKVQCLVKDGGSKDGTVKVLKKFGKKIKWISERDKGQTDAINKGVKDVLKKSKKPKQEFFAYLNSDDYYLPGALDTVAQAFAAHPKKDWLVGECEIVDAQGKPIQSFVKTYKNLLRKMLSRPLLLIANPIPQPAVFMRVSALKKVGPFNEQLRYTMDYQYWLRLWKKSGPPLQVSQPLAAFRIHGSSKGTVSFDKQFAEQFSVAQKFTQNVVWLLLQRLHNTLIITSYKVLK